MEDLSLHILDIVENSIAANAKRVEIRIVENVKKDLLSIEIKDDGKGLNKQTLKKVFDPFFTTRTTRRVGLGLSLLYQSARETGGDVKISSRIGKGTVVKAIFQYSHPDRKPLGNIDETMKVLHTGHPEIQFIFEYKKE